MIGKLEYEDRAEYTCVARNPLSGESSANDTVMVRVKGNQPVAFDDLFSFLPGFMSCRLILCLCKTT